MTDSNRPPVPHDTNDLFSSRTTEDWLRLLQKSRSEREASQAGRSTWQTFLDTFEPHLETLTRQIRVFYNSNVEKQSTEHHRSLAQSTRSALRFGLSCLSAEDHVTRKQIQIHLAHQCNCHEWLCRLLMLTPRSSGIDTNIYTLSARLLCNIVTQNPTTSTSLLSGVAAQPSQDVIQTSLVQDLQRGVEEEENKEFIRDGEFCDVGVNWLDMLMSSTRSFASRETLAAVVAAIYNALMALEAVSDPTRNSDNRQSQYAQQMAESGLFVSTLLRHFVSSGAYSTVIVDEKETGVESDDATLWITNLFMYFLRQGYLSHAYRSVGSVSSMLPEQVALLYCVRSEIDKRVVQGDNGASSSLLFCSKESALSFVLFLYSVYSNVRAIVSDRRFQNDGEEEQTQVLGKAIVLVVVDMMGCYLGVHNATTAWIRDCLGTQTRIVEELCKHLAQIYDSVSIRKHIDGRQVLLHKDEQETIIGLVRLIGNLAFHCRRNQDLIRTIMVPRCPTGESDMRSAFHVILSTTSLSHSCFTLREWGLVAIRFLVENNEENQQVLAALEAQQPVQSAELQSMGITVEMSAKGVVNIRHSSEQDGNASSD